MSPGEGTTGAVSPPLAIDPPLPPPCRQQPIIPSDMQTVSSNTSAMARYLGTFPVFTPEHTRTQTISRIIQLIRDKHSFSVGFLRKSARSFWSPQDSLPKPDGNEISEMFKPEIFLSGSSPLPPDDYPLRPERLRFYHKQACSKCRPCRSTDLHPDCYFVTMLRCVTHGWKLPLDPNLIAPVYRTRGNYPSVSHFPDSFGKEHLDMVDQGVLRKCSKTGSTVINPMGAQIKNSDRVRAKVLVGMDVTDQESMSSASSKLIAMAEPKIKCRITLDPTATGINRATLDVPFRYPSISDFIAIVRKDAILGLTDIGRYFHSFPLAAESRDLLSVEYQGQPYHYARCAFGYRLCPYYCSTWSAEFKTWFRHLGIPTAHMVDDWLTVASTDPLTRQQIQRIEAIFKDIGFYISDDKRRFGHRQVALGVLIDTVSMRLSFDKTQARGTRHMLQSLLNAFMSLQKPDHTLLRHMCGKLNWYAEVLQSGRLHLRSFWLYLIHGQSLRGQARDVFVHDAKWWIALLTSWEDETVNQLSYRIWSSSELLKPQSIYLVQSDASGTDGFGFHHGFLEDAEQHYYSRRWDTSFKPSSSHVAELHALQYALTQLAAQHTDQVLVWVSDSQSAVASVNSPKCHKDAPYALLASIFEQADRHRVVLLALWVPREENVLADYLSHLACMLDRSEVSGSVKTLYDHAR